MTDTITALAPETASRSLFQLAAIRFKRNRPAMAGCVVLTLITLFSFLGPYFISHTYDQAVSYTHLTLPTTPYV